MASTPPTLASLSAMDLSAPEQLQPTQTGNAGTSTSGSSSVAFKIVLLGEGRVGKTSLLLRFTKTAAFDERQVPTIQAAFLKRTVRVDAMGKYANAELNIWDTAGQVRTQALPHIYIYIYVYVHIREEKMQQRHEGHILPLDERTRLSVPRLVCLRTCICTWCLIYIARVSHSPPWTHGCLCICTCATHLSTFCRSVSMRSGLFIIETRMRRFSSLILQVRTH